MYSIFSFVCEFLCVFLLALSFESIFVHSTGKMQMRSILYSVWLRFQFGIEQKLRWFDLTFVNGMYEHTYPEHLYIFTFNPSSCYVYPSCSQFRFEFQMWISQSFEHLIAEMQLLECGFCCMRSVWFHLYHFEKSIIIIHKGSCTQFHSNTHGVADRAKSFDVRYDHFIVLIEFVHFFDRG